MSYNNIERLKSKIISLSNNIVVNHITKVAYKDRDGKRKFGMSEYFYNTNIYSDVKTISSINLTFNSYIEIVDITRDWTDNRSVMITEDGIYKLINGLKEVLSWFNTKLYPTLFYEEESYGLMVNARYRTMNVTIRFGINSVLMFYPSVFSNEDEIYTKGVRIIINNEKCTSVISKEKIEALYYNLSNINLYIAGLLMMNYLQRPEFGKYVTYMNDNNYIESRTEAKIRKEEKDEHDKYFNKFFK